MKTGRPILADDKKKRSTSISLTPLQLQLLDKLVDDRQFGVIRWTRSKMIGALIEEHSRDILGVVGGVEKHTGNGHYTIRNLRTGEERPIKACNPHSIKGMCENSACQAVYKKEGWL